MGRGMVISLTLGFTLLAVGHADVWELPEPKGYACNATYPDSGPVPYVEIFPPGCRYNPADSAFCYYYIVGRMDCGPGMDVTLRWNGNLVNPVMPHRVLVPRDGKSLVTLDDYGRIGYDNCVVIYGEQGEVLGRYSLSDLYSDETIRRIPRSSSSRWWLEDPRLLFSEDDRYFYLMPLGPSVQSEQAQPRQVHRFDLRTGDMRVLLAPESDAGAGYRAEGGEYLLRFSSLSDIRDHRARE